MFGPGEEIICVDDSPGYGNGEPCELVRGKTYVVLDVCNDGHVRVTKNRRYWHPKRFRRPEIVEEEDKVSISSRAP